MDKEIEKKLLRIVRPFKSLEDNFKDGEYWYKVFVERGLLKEGMKILDYGAGLGRLAVPFSKLVKVVATDPNEEMVKFLEEKGIETYNRGDCSALGEHKKFDFIISTFVFQHIPLELTQMITRQMAGYSDTLYFTFPTYELFEELGRPIPAGYKPPEEVNKDKRGEFDTHEFASIILHENELGRLFEGSDWNVDTLRRPIDKFKNLFIITK